MYTIHSLPYRRFLLSLLSLVLTGTITGAAQTVEFVSQPYQSGSQMAKAMRGVEYVYRAEAEASDGSEVRYSLRFGPSGMRVEARTGLVFWTPKGDGDIDIEIRAELARDPAIYTVQQWKVQVGSASQYIGCNGKDAWVSPGDGIPGWGLGATVLRDELYLLHRPSAGENHLLSVSRWDGDTWKPVTEIERHIAGTLAPSHRGSIIAYKGDLYIYYLLNASTPNETPAGLRKWDGVSLSEIETNGLIGIYDMEVHDDKLNVLGVWGEGEEIYYRVATWDGVEWQTLFQNSVPGLYNRGDQLISLKGNLYVHSLYNNLLGELVDGEVKPLENIPFSLQSRIENVAPYQDGFAFVTDSTRVMIWKDGVLENLGMPAPGFFLLPSLFFVNGDDIYIGGAYVSYTNIREGKGTKIYRLWRYSGTEWEAVSEATSSHIKSVWWETDLVEYHDKIFLYGDLQRSCGNALSNIGYLCSDECGRIIGSVYHDENRNCTRDQNEAGLEGHTILVNSTPYNYVNSDGDFTLVVPPGTYTLNLQPKENWMSTCSGSQQAFLASPGAVANGFDFGVDSAGTSSAEDEQRASHSIEIYPNPAQERAMISFTLNQREEVTLRLIDPQGIVIQELLDERLEAGTHYIELETGELASGPFFLLIERDGEKEIRPLVINK